MNQNRVIKFRVWDKKQNFWWSYENKALLNVSLTLDGRPLFWTGDECRFEGKFWPHEDWVIQQFTGLHDKNNKEIYEGDIVKGIDLNFGPGRAIVNFDTFGIHYSPCDHLLSEDEPYLAFTQEHNEVVGNIFENPELLTV